MKMSVAVREGDEGWPTGTRFVKLDRDDLYGLKRRLHEPPAGLPAIPFTGL
jgi:hypothetical protein